VFRRGGCFDRRLVSKRRRPETVFIGFPNESGFTKGFADKLSIKGTIVGWYVILRNGKSNETNKRIDGD
jgi:hypothetical protein